MHQVVEFAVGLDEQLLEKILGFGARTGQPPREPVQAVEMRAHEALKGEIMFSAAHNTVECIARQYPGKDPIGVFVYWPLPS